MRELVSILLLACITACTPGARQERPPRPQASTSLAAELNSQDRDFLERAATGDNAEISIGKLAEQRATRPEVLLFGRMLISDHTSTRNELAAIAAARNISLPTSLSEHQAAFDRLAGKNGESFDQELGRVAVDEHQDASELFRSEAANGSDPALKAFAARTLPLIERHLQQAQMLKVATTPAQP